MDKQKVIATLVAEGWTKEAAAVAAAVLDRWDAPLPLPSLIKKIVRRVFVEAA